LPIIVHQGNQGGIELGFNYRTRLTGLAQEEAEALGLILAASNPMLAALGLDTAARHARAKLIESLPDTSRATVQRTQYRFQVALPDRQDDPRIEAMAKAVRNSLRIRLRFSTPNEQLIHPTAMRLDGSDWHVHDSLREVWVPRSDWGQINVSARTFE